MLSVIKAGVARVGLTLFGWQRAISDGKTQATDPDKLPVQEENEAKIRSALQNWVIPEIEKVCRLLAMDKKNLAEALLKRHSSCLQILDGPGNVELRMGPLLQLALSDPELYHSTFIWSRVAKRFLPKDFRPKYPETVVERIPLTFEWIGTRKRGNTAEEARIRKAAADWVFPALAKKVPSMDQPEAEDILDRLLSESEKTLAILSGPSSREEKTLELVTLGLTDGALSSPSAITIDKFCAALPIQLQLNLCDHCGNSYPRSSMKSGSRCWDCWGG